MRQIGSSEPTIIFRQLACRSSRCCIVDVNSCNIIAENKIIFTYFLNATNIFLHSSLIYLFLILCINCIDVTVLCENRHIHYEKNRPSIKLKRHLGRSFNSFNKRLTSIQACIPSNCHFK